MTHFMKCDLCNTEIAGEKCVFAVHRRSRDGVDHYFCCERHADEFQHTQAR